ncbi:actin binding protein [Pelomyxa schiedti]|nr:actin binding protein [Pelomyxa schiedti]
MAAVRARSTSKFKNLMGAELQMQECYGNVKPGVSNVDSNIIKTNGTYFAFAGLVHGQVYVHPLSQKGAAPDDRPFFLNEESNVTDLDLCQNNDNLLAAAYEDGKALVYRIPDTGLTEVVTAPTGELVGHDKRLLYTEFHPLAANVLLTSDAGKITKLWDVEQLTEGCTFPASGGVVVNASWNLDGSLCATISKDKVLRVVDPRGNTIVSQVLAHLGAKVGRVSWLGRLDRILSIGFGSGSGREILMFDPRNIAKPIANVQIETGSSTLLPFVDEDLSLIYLAGKGEGLIRTYEIADAQLTLVSQFQSKDPQSSVSMLRKTSLDFMKCEVARFLKLVETKRLLVPVRFTVPRQGSANIFQEDLYPATWDHQPTMTATDFFGGASGRTPTLLTPHP